MHPLDDYVAGPEVPACLVDGLHLRKALDAVIDSMSRIALEPRSHMYGDLLIRPKMRLKAHFQAQAISASAQFASQAAMNSTLFAGACARSHRCSGRALSCFQGSGPKSGCVLADVAIGALQLSFDLLQPETACAF